MDRQVNIYRNAGVWSYALWIGGECDHSDTLDAESEAEARAVAAEQFPGAAIARVSDTQE
jgi:hypothetical protein